MSSIISASSDSIAGTLFKRDLMAVFRNVRYSSAEGGDVSAESVYIVTTAMRAGIRFSSNMGVIAASVTTSAERRRGRLREEVPALAFSLMALRIEDTPVKTCGAAVGVFKALHSVLMTVIIHSGSSVGAPLGRFAVDFSVRVFEGVGLLGVGFAEVVRDFFGVTGAGGSSCFVVARAVLRKAKTFL
jgi:hypothetical protein